VRVEQAPEGVACGAELGADADGVVAGLISRRRIRGWGIPGRVE
jgi:hypothetical protein